MNRVFYMHIAWYKYFYLLVLGGVTFFFFWNKQVIPAVFGTVILVLLIERMLHTTYTITPDNKLVVSMGRFSKDKTCIIKDIVSIERRHSVVLGTRSLLNYILIEYIPGKYISVMPVKEDEFIDVLLKRRQEDNA